jgi:putative ABC transport system permease protein
VPGSTARLLWYRFRITLYRRWGGYLALAVLIGLLGGVAMASLVAARRTDSSYPKFLASTNPSDLIVQPNGGDPHAGRLLPQIARLPHVQQQETAMSLEAATIAPGGGIGTVLQSQVQLIASANGLFANQDRVAILRGRPADRPDEIVASPRAAALLGLHVGSRVRVGIWTGSQRAVTPFYRKLDLTVVGVGVFNTQVLQDDIDSGRTGFLLGTPALARQFGSCCTSDVYVGLVLNGGSRYDAAVEREYENLENTSPFYAGGGGQLLQILQVYVTSDIEAQAQRAIRPEAIALAVFGVIAGLAALLIGVQSISRQLQAGSGETQVLRALGAGPAATTAAGLPGILCAIVAGSLLAMAVAGGLSPLTLFGPARAAESSAGIYLDWTVLGLGGLGLVALLGAVAAGAGYRLAPHRAAAREQATGHGSSLVRAALATGLPASAVAGARFALEPGRGPTSVPTRSVIIGAVLATGVVMATLTFGAGLSTLVSHPALYGWDFNYALYSTDGWGPWPAAVTGPLLHQDHLIQATTGVYFLTVQIDGQTVPTVLSPVRPAVGPRVLSGHGLAGPSQIVLGPATLAQLHKRVGDMVTVALGTVIRHARLRIAGTAALPTIGDTLGIHATIGTGALFATAVVPVSVFRTEYGSDYGPNAIFVRLRPGVSPAAGLRSLDKIAATYNRIAHSPQTVASAGLTALELQASVLPAQRPAEIVNYRTMGAMPAILAAGLAGGAVAALGITLITSVRRRRRDFALLKTLGFTRRQLATAVAWQSTIIAVVGLVVGMPLGIAAGRWLWLLFAGELSAVPRAAIPAASIALAAIAALILANLVAALPGRLAARTPAATVLRTE